MTKPVDPEITAPEDTVIEGTVFTPRQVGMLKVAVVVMGILLLAALAAVIVGMIYQASKLGGKSPAIAPAATPATSAPAHHRVDMSPASATAPEALVIPSGGEVISMSLDGDRLALHVRTGDDDEIVVVEISTGKVVSRVKIDKGGQPPQ